MSNMVDLEQQSWYRILTTDPDEQEQDLIGLLGSELHWHNAPDAERMHVASCEGVSVVHVELNVAGRTLSFFLNTAYARETLDSLATALGVDVPA